MIGWLRGLFANTPATGEWTVAAGSEEGSPIIVRTRTRAPNAMLLQNYPSSVEVVWPFDGTQSDGMPSQELNAQMLRCEDALGTLEGPENGLLGMTITGNGRREWVWYVVDGEQFSLRVRELLAQPGERFAVEVRRATIPS